MAGDDPPRPGGTTSRLSILVTRVRAGDDAALNELLIYVEGRLRALTRRLLRDFPNVRRFEQTEDVYQQAVLRLLRSLKSVEPADFAHFLRLAAVQIRRELLTLAQRYRHDAGRGAGPEGHATPDVGAVCQVAESTAGPSELALWTEFHESVDRLPAEQRDVFDLIFYHGLTRLEAAEILGVSERTVRGRLLRAKLALIEKLGGRLPGP